ncbi:hypothetical protein DFH28DRAFT_927714 [Melampsora americana]|nr:hypothetical protein DFH28DRAFT_927714 [Melampsora americana]
MRVSKNIASSDCTWTALETDEYLQIDECLSRLSDLFGEVKKSITEAISSFHSKPETMMALGGLLWYLGQLNLDRELLSCDDVWKEGHEQAENNSKNNNSTQTSILPMPCIGCQQELSIDQVQASRKVLSG